jgi:hypothetical protein
MVSSSEVAPLGSQTFRRNLLHPSSEPKSKPGKEPAKNYTDSLFLYLLFEIEAVCSETSENYRFTARHITENSALRLCICC